MAFAPDGKSLASVYVTSADPETSSIELELVLWDIPTDRVRNVDSIKNQMITAFAFHPDGKKLYLAAGQGLLEMDLATHAVTSLGTGFANVMAFNPDGRFLAAASSYDKTIRLWDIGNRQAIGKALVGHTDQITSLAFNQEGTLLASGGRDGLRVWDVGTGGLVGPLLTGALASQVAFAHSQGHSSLFADAGGIRQWPMDSRAWLDRACQIANRNLTQAEWETYFDEEPYHKTCPDLPVPPALVQVLFDSGARLAFQGEIEEAIERYETAVNLAPDFRTPVGTLNAYCWFGSLYGHASEVLPYCDEAIQAAPEAFAVRDSRGLARALTGDFAGAIEDFQFFVERAAGAGYSAQTIQQRRGWIVDLKAGRDPFTPELLEQLKRQ
jgi:tetratricopeptide (TPR) repeat protein